jgi:predicted dehydrogenase
MDNVRIAAVCDIIEEKATKLAGTLGCEAFVDYRPLLEKVQAVWICTPPGVRIELIAAAARSGLDIFCEKPVALNLAEADQIIDVVNATGVKFMLGYVLRFTQPFRLLHDTFASGELGKLVNCWTRRYMAMDPRKTWHVDQEASGGVALDFGSHDIDWLMTVGGKVKAVFAQAARVREGVRSDEHSQSLLSFAGGGMGCCDVSWVESVRESSIGVVGTEGSLAVGRGGKLYKRMVGQKEEQLDVEASMTVDSTGNLGKAAADGGVEAVAHRGETIQQHFIRCIEEDLRPDITPEQGKDVLRTVLAINESAHTGLSVEIPAD